MIPPLIATVVAAGLAVVVLGGGVASASDPRGEAPSSHGLSTLQGAMDRVGLGADWQAFLAAKSYGESRWNPRVSLGPNDHPGRPPWAARSKSSSSLQAAEARAARIAYERNLARYEGSPYDPERYQFGSGGLFGLLPSNALATFRGTDLIHQDPWLVFDPESAMVMALGYARGLMRWKQWRNSPQTWLTLAVGWASPGAMDNPNGSTYARVSKRLEKNYAAAGLDPAWIHRRVSALDLPSSADRWRALKGAGGVS